MLQEAQQEMVLKNMRLVHHVAKRYKIIGKRHGYDFEDLVSIGTIALIKSVKEFRTEFNTKLSTFAFPRIQTEIRNTINTSRSMRTSRLYVDVLAKITFHNLIDLPVKVIAERLQESESKVQTAIDMHRNKVVSIYKEVAVANHNRVDQKTMLIDTIPFRDDDSLVYMHEFFGLLDERECRIVGMRIEGKTQDQIADELGNSQVHISRLIKKIQQKWEQYQRGEYLA